MPKLPPTIALSCSAILRQLLTNFYASTEEGELILGDWAARGEEDKQQSFPCQDGVACFAWKTVLKMCRCLQTHILFKTRVQWRCWQCCLCNDYFQDRKADVVKKPWPQVWDKRVALTFQYWVVQSAFFQATVDRSIFSLFIAQTWGCIVAARPSGRCCLWSTGLRDWAGFGFYSLSVEVIGYIFNALAVCSVGY